MPKLEEILEIGNRLVESHSYDAAINVYKQALEMELDDEILHTNLSYACLMAERYEEGVKQLEGYLKGKNTDDISQDVLINLGRGYSEVSGICYR